MTIGVDGVGLSAILGRSSMVQCRVYASAANVQNYDFENTSVEQWNKGQSKLVSFETNAFLCGDNQNWIFIFILR